MSDSTTLLIDRREGKRLALKAANLPEPYRSARALLEALEEMMEAHSLHAEYTGMGGSNRRLAAKKKARAVIAKARPNPCGSARDE